MAAGLTLALNACATRAVVPLPSPAERLALAIDSVVDAPPLHRAGWGILIRDAATGTTLYDRNGHRLHIPASNQKIVLATAALGLLGPDFRYRTEVRAGGALQVHAADTGSAAAPARRPLGEVVAGGFDAAAGGAVDRLVVTGTGDPTWSVRFHDSVQAPFDSLAAGVARAGVTRAGRLVVDVSRFRDEPVHPTWEVSDLPGVFAPPVDAFAAAEGTFRLVLTGGAAVGAPGSAAAAAPLHQPVSAVVVTDTAGARPSVSTDFRARRDTIYLSARVGLGASDTVTLAVTRPAPTAAAALADALRRRGVAVDSVLVVRDPAEAALLREGTAAVAAYESPPMVDIVAGILRPSQNWMAEQVLKTLGYTLGTAGSWAGGNDVVRTYLYDVAGVDSGSIQLRDASGMSAQNLLSPEATLAMLAHGRSQSWGAAWRDAFPQPGMRGSTLSGRLEGLEGRVFAKTGTITNVNSLSGFFVAADGREYLFSILTNGSGLPAATMRAAIDEVVRAMARHLDQR